MAQLFMLKHDFPDPTASPDGLFYCPDCATIEGVLALYPALRHSLTIQYLDFPRPRPALVELLGADHQGCPVLVLDAHEAAALPGHAYQTHGTYRFLADPTAILPWLADRFGIARPH